MLEDTWARRGEDSEEHKQNNQKIKSGQLLRKIEAKTVRYTVMAKGENKVKDQSDVYR